MTGRMPRIRPGLPLRFSADTIAAMTADPAIVLAARLLGGLVFVTAVAGKIKHRHELAGVVANYRLLPERAAGASGWIIVGLECLAGLSLFSGLWLAAGAALAIALLGGFALAMSINLARGRREIDCGCFQLGLRQRLSAGLVVRNLVLAIILLPLLSAGVGNATPLQWVDGLGAGLAAYILYLALGEIASLRHLSADLRRRFA